MIQPSNKGSRLRKHPTTRSPNLEFRKLRYTTTQPHWNQNRNLYFITPDVGEGQRDSEDKADLVPHSRKTKMKRLVQKEHVAVQSH
jgi:hypothetical protein